MSAPARATSLGANLAVFMVPPLLLNGVIFGLGWNGNTAPSPYLPPGWLVGTIWMMLFAAMGAARWLLMRRGAELAARGGIEPIPRGTWLVSLLAFLCLIYPLYTVGLSSERIGLAGSIVTGVVAVWVIARIVAISRAAAALTGLVLGWLIYASVALARTIATS